ncbi:MAG TPA: response regulator [Anaeromyxobacteraceae bacterium]
MPSATILIVEDEERVRSALRRSLRRTTHDLLVAESGNAALALLEQEAVDVILSDDCMRGMSGIQLLRQARLVKPCAARLMLTDRARLETAMEAVRRGDIDRLLTKPWADGELREALDTAAEKVRAAAAARAEDVAARHGGTRT